MFWRTCCSVVPSQNFHGRPNLQRPRVRPRCRDHCRLSLPRRPPAPQQPAAQPLSRAHQSLQTQTLTRLRASSSSFCFPRRIPLAPENRHSTGAATSQLVPLCAPRRCLRLAFVAEAPRAAASYDLSHGIALAAERREGIVHCHWRWRDAVHMRTRVCVHSRVQLVARLEREREHAHTRERLCAVSVQTERQAAPQHTLSLSCSQVHCSLYKYCIAPLSK